MKNYLTILLILFSSFVFAQGKVVLKVVGAVPFDSSFIYAALVDTAAQIRADFPTGGMPDGLFWDSTDISADSTRYIFYSGEDSVYTIGINSSVNFANTNLSFNSNRIHNARGYSLAIQNMNGYGFTGVNGNITQNSGVLSLQHSTKINILSPIVSFPSTAQNDALTRIAVLDGSNNLGWRDVSTISGGGSVTKVYEELTATASQTVFTFTSVPATSTGYMVYINGAAIPKTFYSVSGNDITFSSGLTLNDSVIIQGIQ